jgi:hypothetical protein
MPLIPQDWSLSPARQVVVSQQPAQAPPLHWQAPSTHCCPSTQRLPQPPQWRGLSLGRTQEWPHAF